MPELVAVVDTGPIIHLGEVDALDLLGLVDRLYVPEVVFRELAVGGIPLGLDEIDYTTVDTECTSDHSSDLDPGEAAALTVALDRGATILTDDLAARERALAHGLDVHGSIGVVALGYARGMYDRDEAAVLMRALQRESKLFVTEAVVERGIDALAERR